MEDEENYQWINARDRNKAQIKPPAPPKIDKDISEVVGRPIYVNDPRLIRLVVKWQNAKENPDEEDEFLKDSAKITELRRVFNPERFGLEPLKI